MVPVLLGRDLPNSFRGRMRVISNRSTTLVSRSGGHVMPVSPWSVMLRGVIWLKSILFLDFFLHAHFKIFKVVPTMEMSLSAFYNEIIFRKVLLTPDYINIHVFPPKIFSPGSCLVVKWSRIQHCHRCAWGSIRGLGTSACCCFGLKTFPWDRFFEEELLSQILSFDRCDQ